MNKYLNERARYYIVEKMNPPTISRYNSEQQFVALLERIVSISNTMSRSLDFIDGETPEIIDTINKAMDTLEIKIQVIRESLRFFSKIKMDIMAVSDNADISMVDLSKCTFVNMNYSLSDSGIVLSSDTTIHLRKSA